MVLFYWPCVRWPEKICDSATVRDWTNGSPRPNAEYRSLLFVEIHYSHQLRRRWLQIAYQCCHVGGPMHCRQTHERPHKGANGVSWPPPLEKGWKLNSENVQKSGFLRLCYILRAIRAGRCRERRYADHIFNQTYFRMHHFVVKFSKFSSPQAARGHLPPNQNPAHWRRQGGPGGSGPPMAGQKRINAMFTSERRY